MCGRFGQIDKDALAEAYHLDASRVDAFTPNYNTDVGSYGLIVRNDAPDRLSWSVFGLTPFWADKPKYVFNARSEGDGNRTNDPAYEGEKGIFKKPFFRHLKRKRCIVPVQYFVEGPEKERLKKPYVIERLDGRPFALGGLWDEWVDEGTGEVLPNFTVITTPRNELLGMVGHHRAPLVLPDERVKEWSDPDLERSRIESLMVPFDPQGFQAKPVDPQLRRKNERGQNNSPMLIEAIGEPLSVGS